MSQEYTNLKESATELPFKIATKYDFSYNENFNYQQFYIYDRTWDHIDIQAIYTVDGIRHESAKSRYSLKKGYIGTTGISATTAPSSYQSETFGIDGMRHKSLSKGLNIVRSTAKDGTVTVRKIMK